MPAAFRAAPARKGDQVRTAPLRCSKSEFRAAKTALPARILPSAGPNPPSTDCETPRSHSGGSPASPLFPRAAARPHLRRQRLLRSQPGRGCYSLQRRPRRPALRLPNRPFRPGRHPPRSQRPSYQASICPLRPSACRVPQQGGRRRRLSSLPPPQEPRILPRCVPQRRMGIPSRLPEAPVKPAAQRNIKRAERSRFVEGCVRRSRNRSPSNQFRKRWKAIRSAPAPNHLLHKNRAPSPVFATPDPETPKRTCDSQVPILLSQRVLESLISESKRRTGFGVSCRVGNDPLPVPIHFGRRERNAHRAEF